MTESAPKLYLLDVEGTVAPLTLTTEQLVPLHGHILPEFLEAKVCSDPEVQADLALLAEENRAEIDAMRRESRHNATRRIRPSRNVC